MKQKKFLAVILAVLLISQHFPAIAYAADAVAPVEPVDVQHSEEQSGASHTEEPGDELRTEESGGASHTEEPGDELRTEESGGASHTEEPGDELRTEEQSGALHSDAPIEALQAEEPGEDTESLPEPEVEPIPALQIVVPGFVIFAGDSFTYEVSDDIAGLDELVVTEPAKKGSVVIGDDEITYNAYSGSAGTDTFEVSLFRDGSAHAETVWEFSVEIIGSLSAPPVLHLTVSEDDSISFNLEGFFPADLPYTFSIAVDAVAGTAAMSGSTVTYTTGLSSLSSDSFTVLVAAKNNAAINASVVFSIERYGFPLFTTTPDFISTGKNAPYNLNTEGLATDPHDRALVYSIDDAPINGTAAFNDGILTYTPNSNYTGTGSFILHVSNGVNTDECVFYVFIDSFSPVAVDDEVSANSTDASFLIDVLANDVSTDNVALEIISVSSVSAGSTAIEGDKIRYTPDPRNKTDVTFTYTIGYADVEDSLTATATVIIYITNDNFIPVITPEESGYVIDEDEPLSFTFTVEDRDIDDIMTGLTVSITSSNQDVFADGDVVIFEPNKLSDDLVSYTVTWMPVEDANTTEYGAVSVYITASDELEGSRTVTVPVTVNPVNDDPELSRLDLEWRMLEDETKSFTFRVYDVDTLDPLTEFKNITITSSNQTILKNANITISAPALVDARTAEYTVTFKPEANQNTSDDLDPAISGIDISISLEDSEGGTAWSKWELLIDPVNDAPIAKNYILVIDEDEVVDFHVITDSFDVDIATNGDVLSIVSFDDITSAGGIVELIPAEGTEGEEGFVPAYLKYTPYQDYYGYDSFSYIIRDIAGEISTGFMFITLLPVNDPPEFIGLDDNYTVEEDAPTISRRITFNVYDVESPAESLLVQAISLNTSKIPGVLIEYNPFDPGECTLVYTLASNQNSTKGGPVPVRLIVSDTELTTEKVIYINITPVNDAPVARNISYTYDEDGTLKIFIADIMTYVSDVDIATDDDEVRFVDFFGLSEGHLEYVDDESGDYLLFTSVPDSENNVTFKYIVEDLAGAQATATITLVCIPVNDPPRLQDIIPTSGTWFEVNEDESITIPFKFYDPETPNDKLIVILTSSDPSVVNHFSLSVINYNQEGLDKTVWGADLVITPLPDKHTGDSVLTVTITISDGFNSVHKSFLLKVNPMPDAPTAVNDFYTVRAGNTLTFNPLDNDYDVDGDEIVMYSISDPTPEEGRLFPLGGGRYAFVANEEYVGPVVLKYKIIDDSDAGEGGSGLISNEGIITITVTEQSTGPSLRAQESVVTFIGGVVDLDLTVRNIPPGSPYSLTVISSNTSVVAVMDISGQGPSADGLTGSTQTLTLNAKGMGQTLITVILDYGTISDSISFYTTVSDENNPPTSTPTYVTIRETQNDMYFDVLINCDDVEKPLNLKLMQILPRDGATTSTPYLGYNATVSIVEYEGKQQIRYQVVGTNYAQSYWNGTDIIRYLVVDGGGKSVVGELHVTREPVDNPPYANRDVFYIEYSDISTGRTGLDPLLNDGDFDDQYGSKYSPLKRYGAEWEDIKIIDVTPVGAAAVAFPLTIDEGGRTVSFPPDAPPGWYDYTYKIENTGWSGDPKTHSNTIWIAVKDNDGVVPPRVSSRGTFVFDEDTRTFASGTAFTDNARGSIYAGEPYEGTGMEDYKLYIEITGITANKDGKTVPYSDIIDIDAAANKIFGVDIVNNLGIPLGDAGEDGDGNDYLIDDPTSYTTFRFYAKDDAYGNLSISWRAYAVYSDGGEPIYSTNTATSSITIRPVNDDPEIKLIDPDNHSSVVIFRSDTIKIPLYVNDVDLDFSNPAEVASGLTFSVSSNENINIPPETQIRVYRDWDSGDPHQFILELTPIRSETDFSPSVITVTVSDGFTSDSITVTAFVLPKNTPPVAREHFGFTWEDTRASFPVVIASGTDDEVSDIDRDNLTIHINDDGASVTIGAVTTIEIPEGGWPRELGLFQAVLDENGVEIGERSVGADRGIISVAGRSIIFQPAENYNNWDGDSESGNPLGDGELRVYFMLHDGLEFSKVDTTGAGAGVGVLRIKVGAVNDPPEIYGLAGAYTMYEDEEDYFVVFRARDVDGDILDETDENGVFKSFSVKWVDDSAPKHIKSMEVVSVELQSDGSYLCKLHVVTNRYQFCDDATCPHIVTLTVTDGEYDTDASFSLSITAVNNGLYLLSVGEQEDNGVADEDLQEDEFLFHFIRDEDEVFRINFEDYFKDIENDPIAITSIGLVTHGSLVRTSNTVITFTPAKDYNSFEKWVDGVLIRKEPGEIVDGDYAQMTLTLSDPYGESHTVTIKILLMPVNDAPNANNFTVTTLEDTRLSGIDPFIGSRVFDIDNTIDELFITAVGTASNGTVTWIPGSRTFSYMPDPDWFGTDTFTYTVSDPNGLTDTGTVSVVVIADWDDPRIAFEHNTGYSLIPSEEADLLTWAFDEDTTGTFQIRMWTPEAANPLLKITPYTIGEVPYTDIIAAHDIRFSGSGEFRTVTMIPQQDMFGTFGLLFEVDDGKADIVKRYMIVTVNPINDLPVLTGENVIFIDEGIYTSEFTIDEDGSVSKSMSATDVETVPANMIYSVKNEPVNGTLSITQKVSGGARVCDWTYTPDPDWYGTEVFVIQVEDDNSTQFNAPGDYSYPLVHGVTFITITVNVLPVNDAPTAPTDVSLDKTQYKGGETAVLTFTAGTDKWNETPREYLTYDIQVSYNNGSAWSTLVSDWDPTENEEAGGSFIYTYTFTLSSTDTAGLLVRVRTHDTASPIWGSPALYSSYAVTSTASRVDNTPPAVAVTLDPVSSVWTNGSVTITLTITDNDAGFSGIDRVDYSDSRITAVEPGDTPGTYIYTVSENGTFDFGNIYTFTVYDNVGNSRVVNVEVSNIDRLDPVLTFESNSTDDDDMGKNEGDVADQVKITLTVSDPVETEQDGQSGIAETRYLIKDEDIVPEPSDTGWVDYTTPFFLSVHGTWFVYGYVEDNAGNHAIEYLGEYLIYNTDPVVPPQTVTVYEHYVDAIHSNVVSFTLYGTDADGDTLTYTIDDVPDSKYGTVSHVSGNTFKFTHSGLGGFVTSPLLVTYYADDGYGGVVQGEIEIIVIEVNDAPEAPVDMTSPTGGTYYKKDDTITFTWKAGADEETEVEDLKYSIFVKLDGSSWTPVATVDIDALNGEVFEYTYTFGTGDSNTLQFMVKTLDDGIDGTDPWCQPRLSDGAVYTNTYILDNTAPTASHILSPAGWTNGTVTIVLTVTETGSGIKSVAGPDGVITADVDGKYRFTVSELGDYIFTMTDNVDLVGTRTVNVRNIDTLAPVITATSDSKDGDDPGKIVGYAEDPVVLTISYTDQDEDLPISGKSGIATKQYIIKNIESEPTSTDANWKTYTIPVHITARGEWFVYGRAVDNAGNETIEYLGQYFINNTAPVADDLAVTVYEHTVGVNGSSVTFTLPVTDADNDELEYVITGLSFETVNGDDEDSGTGLDTPFGSLVEVDNGVYTFSHNGNGAPPFAVRICFTYYAYDDTADSDVKTVTINVVEVNDSPTPPTDMLTVSTATYTSTDGAEFYTGGDDIVFTWGHGTDEETAESDLRYNIYIVRGIDAPVFLDTVDTTTFTYTCPSDENYDSLKFLVETLDNGLQNSYSEEEVLTSTRVSTDVYKLDNTAPTGSATQSPAVGTYTTDNVLITLTVSDTGAGASGVASVVSDQGLAASGETGLVFIAEVNGTYTFTVTDNVGNEGTVTAVIGNIDRLPPKDITYDLGDSLGTAEDPYEVTIIYEDADATTEYACSGIEIKQYIAIHTAAGQPETPTSAATWLTYTDPVILALRGTWYLYGRAVDKAGNEIITYLGEIDVANSHPVAEDLVISVFEHAAGANSNSVLFTLPVTDTDDDPLEYVIEGWSYETVSAPGTIISTGSATPFGSLVEGADGKFTFTHNGSGAAPFASKIYFTYHATDSFSISATKLVTINVTEVNDTPSAPAGIVSPANGSYYKAGQTIAFSWDAGADEETNIADLRYNIYIKSDGLSWVLLETTAANVLSYTYTCGAGNTNTLQFMVKTLDTGIPGSDPWCYELESGGAAYTNIYILDNTAPAVDHTLTPAGWTNTDVIICLDVTETGSGIASVTGPNGLITAGAGGAYNFTAAVIGDYSFTITDKVGHFITYTVTVENIDKLSPENIECDASDTEGHASNPIVIELTYKDADETLQYKKSGLADTQYILIRSDSGAPSAPGSGAAWQAYTMPLNLTARGTWYLYGRASDNAGNETINYLGAYFIGIDPTQPYTASLAVYKDGAAWEGHSKTFTLELSTDPLKTADISSGTAEVVTGVWKVLDDGVYTGTDITIYGDDGSATLNYYTVAFNVICDGAATDAEITTDSGVCAGDTVLAGTALTLSACGEGAAYYDYEWNDELYTLCDSLTIIVTNTVDLECVVIGYLPGSAPMSYSIIVTLNLDSYPVASGREVTLNGDIPLMYDGNGQHKGHAASGTHLVYVNGIDTGITVMVRYSGVNKATVDLYSLTVEAGDGIEAVDGSGEYLEGSVVPISATTQDGGIFKEWVASHARYTGTPGTAAGSITMPGHTLTLTATGLCPSSENPADGEPSCEVPVSEEPEIGAPDLYADEVLSSTHDASETSPGYNGRRAPQTGDCADTLGWWIVLLSSFLGISGMFIWRRLRQRRDA